MLRDDALGDGARAGVGRDDVDGERANPGERSATSQSDRRRRAFGGLDWAEPPRPSSQSISDSGHATARDAIAKR
jgi:hypothetical protein